MTEKTIGQLLDDVNTTKLALALAQQNHDAARKALNEAPGLAEAGLQVIPEKRGKGRGKNKASGPAKQRVDGGCKQLIDETKNGITADNVVATLKDKWTEAKIRQALDKRSKGEKPWFVKKGEKFFPTSKPAQAATK